jgi:hypothetical protein
MSSKKFYDNKNLESLLRKSQQKEIKDIIFEEENRDEPIITTTNNNDHSNLPAKLKFTKSIKLKNPLNASRDISIETTTTPTKIINNIANGVGDSLSGGVETKFNKVIKKSVSAVEKSSARAAENNIFDFSKQTVHNNKFHNTNSNSPLTSRFYEEDSTKIHSSKITPDQTRFTPNSIRSERSNSRSLRKYTTPPESAKLPTIQTNRGKKEYDIHNIIDAASDYKEDPMIKKKLNDIYQNIEDIRKVLNQRSKNRVKISSAPVGLDDPSLNSCDFMMFDNQYHSKFENNNNNKTTNKLVKNRMVYNHMKIKLNNGLGVGSNLVKGYEKDKFPIKVVKK